MASKKKNNVPIVYTFGCRMNAFESNCIREIMIKLEMYDFILINSCSITAESERQCRQEIRKLYRENPNFHILLTGCSAQLRSSFFRKMPEIDFVIGNEFKLKRHSYELIKSYYSHRDRIYEKYLQTDSDKGNQKDAKRRSLKESKTSKKGSKEDIDRAGDYCIEKTNNDNETCYHCIETKSKELKKLRDEIQEQLLTHNDNNIPSNTIDTTNACRFFSRPDDDTDCHIEGDNNDIQNNDIRNNDIQKEHEDEWEFIQNFEDRSRAFVPIQTGCDHFCAFCIVPFTRGKFHSYSAEHIIRQIQIFVKNNYKEVVLTGIDITDYGKDIRRTRQQKQNDDSSGRVDCIKDDKNTDKNLNNDIRNSNEDGRGDDTCQIDTLGKLCKAILQRTKLERLRLSSVDVAEVDEDIMYLVANERRFMPYFHISAQSGSDYILKKMRRRHTRKDVIEFCRKVLKLRPDACFGADIIAGFPGETEEDFKLSLEMLDIAPITFVHAFPYSQRERTLASLMKDDVPKSVKKDRVKQLIALGRENLKRMYEKMNLTKQRLLIERNGIARAENFVSVKIATSATSANSDICDAVSSGNGKTLAKRDNEAENRVAVKRRRYTKYGDIITKQVFITKDGLFYKE